jgi:hypothetical protein
MRIARQAHVDIASEMLGDCATLLTDHGLEIVGSLVSPHPRVVRLVIAAADNRDLLPSECDHGEIGVNITITQESYGTQRIRRITDISAIAAPGAP